MNQEFLGLYCGYSQEDIQEMTIDIHKRGITSLMDNYIIRKIKDQIFIMEDKWEAELPKELHGDIEKIVLDAVALECLGEKSQFKNLQELTDYMVREEEQDLESYIMHENEWEY